jgi:hypothetical protein
MKLRKKSALPVPLHGLVQSLWVIPAVILGIAFFLLVLLGPLALFAWALVTFIGCDPGLAILLAMAVGVPWSMLLPHLFD